MLTQKDLLIYWNAQNCGNMNIRLTNMILTKIKSVHTFQMCKTFPVKIIE